MFSDTWKGASQFYSIPENNIRISFSPRLVLSADNAPSFTALSDVSQHECLKVKMVLVEIIDIKFTDVGAYIQFTDYTDIMFGTLHPYPRHLPLPDCSRKLVKDYATLLEVGCVICFKDVSILCPTSSGSKYLIFTPGNIEKLFPKV